MSLPVFPHVLLRGSSALNRRGDHVRGRHLRYITVPASFAFAVSMPPLLCHFWFHPSQMSKLCWQHERSPKSSLGDCALISLGAIWHNGAPPQTRLVALSRVGDNLKWTGDNEDLQTRAAVTDEVPVFGRLGERVTGFEAEKSKHCWSLFAFFFFFFPRTMFLVLHFLIWFLFFFLLAIWTVKDCSPQLLIPQCTTCARTRRSKEKKKALMHHHTCTQSLPQSILPGAEDSFSCTETDLVPETEKKVRWWNKLRDDSTSLEQLC